MATNEEVELLIKEQELILDQLNFEYKILQARYEALKVETTYEIEQEAFNMLTPQEQELVRKARQQELSAPVKPRISNQARLMRGRRGMRV